MKTYEGLIEITKIENIGDNAGSIDTLTARFVRYPGAQQLSVWLPESGFIGYGFLKIFNLNSKEILSEENVSQKISGSLLMTWETLEWPPDAYLLEIEHPKGGKHHLFFRKLQENEIVPIDKIVEMPMATAESPALAINLLPKTETQNPENTTLWQVYQDGAGNPIPNDDHSLRASLFEDLKIIFNKKNEQNEPRLEYDDRGRGGYVIYIEGDIQIRFWHEFGGGDCKLFIDVPSAENWEKETNTPLSKRREILLFVANTVRREQAPSWRFEIRDNDIAFY